MNRWPASLPQRMTVDRNGEMGDARVGKDMDAGAKNRRRLSYVPKPFTGLFRMTNAEHAVFEEFVDVTLRGGTLPFLFPAQGGSGVWVVQIGRNMPSWSQTTPAVRMVTLTLVRLPQ